MKKKISKILFLLVSLAVIGISPAFCAEDSDISYIDVSAEELEQQANDAFQKGVRFLRMKSYDNALRMFNEALSFNPQSSDAYYNIGNIYVAKNDIDEAYKNYVKAIAINPRDYDAILQAAKISYNKQNYALAIKYLKHIKDDYEKYYFAQDMLRNAEEQFNTQKNTIERAKISKATPAKRVVIAELISPAGIVVDNSGNTYVASYSDNAIVKIDSNKNQMNLAKDYLLDGPVGIAIDRFDNIYVANYDADNILKITKAGQVSIFMDKVSKPYFLYIKDDILYISEQGNNTIVKYNLANY